MAAKRGGLISVFIFAAVGGVLALVLFYYNRAPVSQPSFAFESFSLEETESANCFISDISKIEFSSGKIFILDRRQKKVFVFNERMSFLYAIGKPGQGPGDLENPADMTVGNDQVVILESIARRINVFTLKGEFVKRVSLVLPEKIFYSYPASILATRNGEYLIAYSLSADLLDAYDGEGRFVRTFLERQDPIIVYRKNIGNASVVGWTPQESVLLFNAFDGEFKEIRLDASLGRQFIAWDAKIAKAVQELRRTIDNETHQSSVQTDVMTFLTFSNFCVDAEGRIYVCRIKTDEKHGQKMWIFEPHGETSTTKLALPDGGRVKALYHHDNTFYFVTSDEKIWTAKRMMK